MSGEESLEEQSFKNLIKYYENDLRRILNGASVNDVFEFADRKTLRHHKIVGYRNREWFLTERAMEILQTE